MMSTASNPSPTTLLPVPTRRLSSFSPSSIPAGASSMSPSPSLSPLLSSLSSPTSLSFSTISPQGPLSPTSLSSSSPPPSSSYFLPIATHSASLPRPDFLNSPRPVNNKPRTASDPTHYYIPSSNSTFGTGTATSVIPSGPVATSSDSMSYRSAPPAPPPPPPGHYSYSRYPLPPMYRQSSHYALSNASGNYSPSPSHPSLISAHANAHANLSPQLLIAATNEALAPKPMAALVSAQVQRYTLRNRLGTADQGLQTTRQYFSGSPANAAAMSSDAESRPRSSSDIPSPTSEYLPAANQSKRARGGSRGSGDGGDSTEYEPSSSPEVRRSPPVHLLSTFAARRPVRSSRKHTCPTCGKRFSRPSSLVTHTYSHTGEKPFACDYAGCNRRFSVVSNLRRHRKIHEGCEEEEGGAE